MKRRDFFKLLSGAVVGCYLACGVKLPQIISKAERVDFDFALTMHQYESRIFSFYPSFQDFIEEHTKQKK